MKGINIFYVVVVLLGIGLFFILQPKTSDDLSFYGIAESRETDINYNYPVVVERIVVAPGQAVSRGDTLMYLSRRKSKETLDDYAFEINKLNAEETIWRNKKKDELNTIRLSSKTKSLEILSKIKQLDSEIAFQKSLSDGLENITSDNSTYSPLEEKKNALKEALNQLNFSVAQEQESIENELRLGKSPYAIEIDKIKAKQTFDADQKVQPIYLLAPDDGLIGNIYCKEEEHIPSYKSLITFYEPHSGTIRGYIHEDLTLQVNMDDSFIVTSLKNENVSYKGKVIGLGSRIVEIPARLRKIESIKSYGREIIVEITKDNSFLQKERVSVSSELND